MASFNKVIIAGNLTATPEIRHTPTGKAVTELRVAMNHRWTDKSGEAREETTFVDVTLWARNAEVACKFLEKGRPVLIEGRLHMDQWQDRTSGQKRSRLRIVGETMQMLGSRNTGGRSATPTEDRTPAMAGAGGVELPKGMFDTPRL